MNFCIGQLVYFSRGSEGLDLRLAPGLIGPLVFGVAVQLTGTQQMAIISLIIFFIVGLRLLSRVNVNQTMAEVKEDLVGVDQ